MRATFAAAAFLVVAVAGCGHDTAGHPGGAQMRCTQDASMPSGFSLVSTVSVAERGHVGTRTTYRGPHGRSLVVLAGIAGEVGEGGTVVARPRLVRGGRARMYRAGPRLILAWRETGPCADRGVIGEGLDRPSFLDAMSAAGIVET